MEFDFTYVKNRAADGYLVDSVRGVRFGGEYDVLEIPPQYAGLPVKGIKNFMEAPCGRKLPHFQQMILPATMEYVNPVIWVGEVDKMTFRGWVPKMSAPVPAVESRAEKTWVCAQKLPGGAPAFALKMTTVVFEGEEVPPHFLAGRPIENLILTNDVKRIGARAFFDAQLRTVKIPPSVLDIGDFAFASRLPRSMDFTLSEGLCGIGAFAFEKRMPTKPFSVPSTVTQIGQGAFDLDYVDRGTLQGRAWKFAIPSRYAATPNSKYFAKTPVPQPDDVKKKLELKMNGCDRLIEGWLNAEDPQRAKTLRGSLASDMKTMFERFDLVCGEAPDRMFCAGYNEVLL